MTDRKVSWEHTRVKGPKTREASSGTFLRITAEIIRYAVLHVVMASLFYSTGKRSMLSESTV
jgi:hypothetical protein